MEHRVRAGECIESIAHQYGFFWETIWNNPANRELRQNRSLPNVLNAGDIVVIPDRRIRSEAVPTKQRHRFRRRGIPIYIEVQLLEEDEPLAGLEYVVDIDGHLTQGQTDSEGCVSVPVPPGARWGSLQLHLPNGTQRQYEFDIGELNPVDEVRGLIQRLQGLGFYCGTRDDESAARLALQEFQTHEGLETTGRLDDATRSALMRRYGC